MHVCNHVTKVTKISTSQFYKMVKLFEEEIHIPTRNAVILCQSDH
jgi:hypothetical protein